MHEDDTPPNASSGRHRRSKGPGKKTAAIAGERDAAGENIGGMEEEEQLRHWAEAGGHVIAEADWEVLPLISNSTAEHEVRYRAEGHRAVKRTWPGTFGFIPRLVNKVWRPVAATPAEFLRRIQLQNRLFGDDVILEGIMLSGKSSIIVGMHGSSLSLVISQPWLEPANDQSPHPTERQIAGYMRDRGFVQLASSFFGWINEAEHIVVLDAKPDNFVLTPHGILPIDLLIAEIP